ncbi:uncharacterized protein MEPE_01563 [Melanopsichium pennsylvanicum]|uniref:Uncharacterized protein n=1 Tax=Melanopsichium pennsylvanicum TaxID=63383 RepID=A0AAJ4XIX0_9BASI|nr:uncharacterized protein MEPE_01563 [Melanopsichium pennsylvanicum]
MPLPLPTSLQLLSTLICANQMHRYSTSHWKPQESTQNEFRMKRLILLGLKLSSGKGWVFQLFLVGHTCRKLWTETRGCRGPLQELEASQAGTEGPDNRLGRICGPSDKQLLAQVASTDKHGGPNPMYTDTRQLGRLTADKAVPDKRDPDKNFKQGLIVMRGHSFQLSRSGAHPLYYSLP